MLAITIGLDVDIGLLRARDQALGFEQTLCSKVFGLARKRL
jgi:hypothetical protein